MSPGNSGKQAMLTGFHLPHVKHVKCPRDGCRQAAGGEAGGQLCSGGSTSASRHPPSPQLRMRAFFSSFLSLFFF